MNTIIKLSTIVAGLVLLTGCAMNEEHIQLPEIEVTSSATKYEDTLRRLNKMIGVFHELPITIIVNTVENRTTGIEKVPADITTMVDTSFTNIGNMISNVAMSHATPKIDDESAKNSYYIHGAITTYDVIESEKHGINAGLHFGSGRGENDSDGSTDYDNKVSEIGITLNASNVKTGKYVSRASTKNGLKVYKKSSSNDFGFSILGSGFGFSNSKMKTQSMHHSLEVLVDLSVVELLGKVLKLPYWMLTDGVPNKNVLAEIEKEFYSLAPYKKIKRISYLLSLQDNNIQVSENITPVLTQAIIRFKQKHHFSKIDNSINKELYMTILGVN